FSPVGPATTLLTGANTYSGGTAINGGTLQVSSDANLGAAVGALSLNGGTLVSIESFSSARATTLNASGGAFDVANDTTLTMSGAIGGIGALAKLNGGTLVLTGTNTYSGGTSIHEGTLQLGDGTTNGTIGGNVANNAVLALNPANGTTTSLAGVISGTGVLNQIGTGTTILTGANTYSGGTSVNAGALFISGNQSAATGTVSVASGAALGGLGTIGGSVNVASGAALRPGVGFGVPGTLTINGNLAFGSGSTMVYQLGQAGAIGGALNDLTVVNGNLTLD